MLGPYLYVTYILPLGDILRRYGMHFHIYADDTQIYVTFDIKDEEDTKKAIVHLETCIAEVRAWMAANYLCCNYDKTELLILGSPHNLKNMPDISVHIGDTDIKPAKTARNIGAILDSTMNMEAHINSVCRNAYLQLRNLSRIRRFLSKEATETLVHSFITTKLDFMNGLLYGLPKTLLRKLQKIQNIAARIITRSKPSDHIKPILQKLHWLPVDKRIEYKILVTAYKGLHGQAPKYISDLLVPYTPKRTLRSKEKCMLTEKRINSKYGARAFSVAAPKLWNSLPCDLKNYQTLESFKTALKTYIFKNTYCC